MSVTMLFGIVLCISVCAYVQYRLAVIYDFEVINGPVLLLDRPTFEQHTKRKQRHYHLLEVSAGATTHYFKVPLFFKEVTINRQQYIIKQTARSNGVRLKHFDLTFVNPEIAT